MNPLSTRPAPTTPGLEILPADTADPARLAAAYETGGAVHLRGVLTAEEIAELREAFTSHIENDGRGGAFDETPEGDPLHAYPRMIQPHRDDHAPGLLARRWLLERRVMGRVAEGVGPVWATLYFKPPGARGQAMHQDNYFLQSESPVSVRGGRPGAGWQGWCW